MINDRLDRWIRPNITAWGRRWRAFEVCQGIGLLLSLLLVVSLTLQLGLSLWVILAIGLSAILTYLGVVLSNKVLFNLERLVYYNFQIAVVATTALLLWGLKQPLLTYLDITVLGIGMCLACTRIGCLMAGCCHGRPAPCGACYGQHHAIAGFTPYYVNVRLFPIQAVESLWVFGIVSIGSLLLFHNPAPGTVVAWYVVAYGGGRFGFEFIRGDAARRYYAGFSEAQWTSLVLIALAIWAEAWNILPSHRWHGIVLGGILLSAISVSINRRLDPSDRYHLLHPNHVQEVAAALELTTKLTPKGSSLSHGRIRCTSLGIEISASTINTEAGLVRYFTLSGQPALVTKATAATLAQLILQLHPPATGELIEKHQGMFHLLMHPTPKHQN